MNMFSALMNPLTDRPGDPVDTVRHRERPANPWGLTGAECRAVEALSRTGRNKDAARKLNISVKSVDIHAANAAKKMGASNRVLAILEWDRFARDRA